MAEIILETKNLVKQFGGLMAVDKVNIHLNKGEILGMIGANGAGKTTLFNLLAGSFHPTSGSIKYRNRDISRMPAHKICSLGIGRTYQIVQPFTNLTVIENVMVGALLHTSSVDIAKRKAEEVLKFTAMYDLRNYRGSGLTLTQMKRMEVAKALATNPDILLLDEVIAGVNPSEHPAFIKLVSDIRERGISIIIIEHVMRVIMNISDRIYVLNQGRVIAEGLPQEVSVNTDVIKSYFGEKRHVEHQ
jgi:branched-chain amino acid transport system ATP-binding protein